MLYREGVFEFLPLTLVDSSRAAFQYTSWSPGFGSVVPPRKTPCESRILWYIIKRFCGGAPVRIPEARVSGGQP